MTDTFWVEQVLYQRKMPIHSYISIHIEDKSDLKIMIVKAVFMAVFA